MYLIHGGKSQVAYLVFIHAVSIQAAALSTQTRRLVRADDAISVERLGTKTLQLRSVNQLTTSMHECSYSIDVHLLLFRVVHHIIQPQRFVPISLFAVLSREIHTVIRTPSCPSPVSFPSRHGGQSTPRVRQVVPGFGSQAAGPAHGGLRAACTSIHWARTDR